MYAWRAARSLPVDELPGLRGHRLAGRLDALVGSGQLGSALLAQRQLAGELVLGLLLGLLAQRANGLQLEAEAPHQREVGVDIITG